MSGTSDRKRPREEEKLKGSSKKRKAETVVEPSAAELQAAPKEKKHNKKHKQRRHDDNDDVTTEASPVKKKTGKKSSKERTEKTGKTDKARKKDSSKNIKSEESKLKVKDVAPEKPAISFPFFTQTISLWVPLYPVGFDKPITSVADQHLAGLVNHYAPQLGGYLLAYHNVSLSEVPVHTNPQNPPTDETPATLSSVDEYAVGFGWMTVDLDLFVPSRGAWLEGDVIIQNDGAIGVNCWEKFNASIEASRLPHGWKYVESDPTDNASAGDPAKALAADDGNGDENMEDDAAMNESGEEKFYDAAEIQPTGHWVDEQGEPVKGKILFRIKSFDVGLAGDNGYLAIEGTMLEEAEERKLAQREREQSRMNHVRGKTRRLPEFSITQFGKEDEEEDSAKKVEVYKGNRPGTPN